MLRFLSGVCVLLTATGSLFAAEPTAQELAFFESEVRPLLIKSCHSCHSTKAKKLQAGLYLDSKFGLLKGGESGPAVVPGKPEESLLISAIKYESFEMPPKGKLPEKDVATLVKWVKMGAPWPKESAPLPNITGKEFDLQQRKQNHWCWQPIRDVKPPAVKQQNWVRNSIDAFVLSRLAAVGLSPAERADKRTLVRRLYFDLIGLPPSPAQVDAFLADESPDAYEKLVDELLKSPHFGEKWARHWMDLVRYAETYGHEFDYPIPHTHQYRDYLIRAFNNDVPYNRFVQEHIAGDLLKPRHHPVDGYNESPIGTAFYWFGEATHSPTDVRGDEAIRIDNQIDVLTRTFLGLTVSCARCHDHKFDAISTKDYYSLTGFLQSSRRHETLLDPGRKIETMSHEMRELYRQGSLHLEKQIKTAPLTGEQVKSYLLTANAANANAEQTKWNNALKAAALNEAHHPLHVWRKLHTLTGEQFKQEHDRLRTSLQQQNQRAEDTRKTVDVVADFSQTPFDGWFTTGDAFPEQLTSGNEWNGSADAPSLLSPHQANGLAYSPKLWGTLRTPTFKLTQPNLHVRINAKNVTIRVIIDGYFMEPYNALLFRGTRLAGNATDTKGTFQWKTIGGDLRNYVGRSAYVEFIDHGDGHVILDQVCLSPGGPPADAPNQVTLNLLSGEKITSAAELAGAYGKLWSELQSKNKQDSLTEDEHAFVNWLLTNQLLPVDTKPLQELVQKITTINQQLPRPMLALGITEGVPEDDRVHIRGNHENLGDVVPRRMLEALSKDVSHSLSKTGSGRLELAEEITDPNNPLTSRVIVNRLWHHLFGRGIVPTVDDFGMMGMLPSHPELLDWLATDFQKRGWSLKTAIKQMVMSQTYQMSSRPHSIDKVKDADPDNILLHRMPIRRLNAEAVRDAILTVSGRLDRKVFGGSVPVHLTPFMEGRGRPRGGPVDGNGRRSLYISIRRNFLPSMLLAFDMPSPFSTMGRRTVSNVPAQALMLMNSPLVVQQSKLWAENLLKEELTTEQRIENMFVTAYAQPPTAQQKQLAMQFLEVQAKTYGSSIDDVRVWADLGHTLFNMKEFIFLK